jgi:hypothetical protein
MNKPVYRPPFWVLTVSLTLWFVILYAIWSKL